MTDEKNCKDLQILTDLTITEKNPILFEGDNKSIITLTGELGLQNAFFEKFNQLLSDDAFGQTSMKTKEHCNFNGLNGSECSDPTKLFNDQDAFMTANSRKHITDKLMFTDAEEKINADHPLEEAKESIPSFDPKRTLYVLNSTLRGYLKRMPPYANEIAACLENEKASIMPLNKEQSKDYYDYSKIEAIIKKFPPLVACVGMLLI